MAKRSRIRDLRRIKSDYYAKSKLESSVTLPKRFVSSVCFAFALMATCSVPSGWAQAQDTPKDASEFLPASTAIYAHIADPAKLIDTIENHPIVEYALELKEVQRLMRTPQFAMFLLGKGLYETNIEETVIEALKTNSGNGIWFALDESGGVIVLLHSKDEARLKRVVGQALKLVATTGGGNVPFEKKDYRDAVAAEFKDSKVLIARYKSWFAITNKSELAKKVVDNMHDGATDPLAKQQWFKDAIAIRTANGNKSDLWAAVDLETVREKSDDKAPFLGVTDNPGVELILGGILDVLKSSPTAFGEINLNDEIHIALSAPFKNEWAHEARDYFFGEKLKGRAPLALKPKNMIANLTSYRDIGQWWLSKEDLYPENVIAELAQADSQLSTIFSGMDFGEDVLGSLEPGVQIVVTENQYDSEYVPDVKVPAFALVGKLKDPKRLTRKLKIAFNSVVGFANIALGQNGQPQLEVETENIGEAKLMSSTYFYEEGTEEGLILFNFGPTIAFKGNDLVIASTKSLAKELVGMLDGGKNAESVNTMMTLDGQMLHKILGENAESLIAQNMVEEGNSRKEAQEQIGIILLIADLFKDAKLNYDVTAKQMKADFSLRFDNIESIKAGRADSK